MSAGGKHLSDEMTDRPAGCHPPAERCVVREYDIASLVDHEENHFRRMDGEKWNEFVGSIREFGVVSPLIIREKAGDAGRYEILAGHNRKSGAAAAGLKTVPCIEVEADDVDASVLVGITNTQRGEVSDLEWGWTYRTTLEAMKHQGVAVPCAFERAGERSVPGASAGAGERSISDTSAGAGERSVDVVARKYGVSRKTVQRKIRLTYLIPQLYDLGKRSHFSQSMLIDLSYLPPVLQTNVVQAVVIERVQLCEASARQLRAAGAKQPLDINDVIRICRENQKKESRRDCPRRSLKYEIPEELFPDDLPKCRRAEYVLAALRFFKGHSGEAVDAPRPP